MDVQWRSHFQWADFSAVRERRACHHKPTKIAFLSAYSRHIRQLLDDPTRVETRDFHAVVWPSRRNHGWQVDEGSGLTLHFVML